MNKNSFWKTVESNKKAVMNWPEWMQALIITAEAASTGKFFKDKPMKKNILTKEEQLKRLRRGFKYNEDGTPDLYSYGEFKGGITTDEIDDYLRVRINCITLPTKIKAKYNKEFGCQTAACVRVNGQEVTLFYRYDVVACANTVLLGKPNLNWD